MIRLVTVLVLLLIAWTNAQTSHSPSHTFMTHLQDFARNTRVFGPLVLKAQEVYRQNGYYVDPRYIPTTNATYKPPCLPSPNVPYYPCYEEYYYSNGYARGGYDRRGYDILGYNLAGYNRLGYSRRQARRGDYPPSSYNQLGNFQNPIYQSNGYHVIFDNYGNPYSGNAQTGPVKPTDPCYNTYFYDILVYDNEGYDQYGNDVYGDPHPQNYPPPCPPRTGYSHIPDEPLICNSSSEILQTSGKYRFIRKSASAMSAADWQRFRNAWNGLNTAGEIGRLVAMHSQNYNQHQSLRFLPWHREFTARLEDLLHRFDPCVFLPYWDVVSDPTFPVGIVDINSPEYPPDVITLDSSNQVISTDDVTVAIGVSGVLPNAGLQTAVLGSATFPAFSPALESFHDQIHVHVGGSLMFISTAPRHPVFYLLHANVDRLWHVWQQTHAGQPTAAVISASIDPLTFGPGDTKTYASQNNINTVQTVRGDGYQYI